MVFGRCRIDAGRASGSVETSAFDVASTEKVSESEASGEFEGDFGGRGLLEGMTPADADEIDDLVEGLRSRTATCMPRSTSHEDVEFGVEDEADGGMVRRHEVGEERGEIREIRDAATQSTLSGVRVGRGRGGHGGGTTTGGVPASHSRLLLRKYVEQWMCCV